MSRYYYSKMIVVLFSVMTLLVSLPASAKETLRIQGSTTVLPIAQKAAAAFMELNPNVDISIEGSGSGHGIKALIDGTTEIANASRFIKTKEAKMAYEKGSMPVPFRVAYDCIIPVVHPKNPVSDITMEDLKAVFNGKIKNWKILGGKDAPITVFSRDTSSGTYGVWNQLVMKKSDITPAAQLKPSNSEMAKIVEQSPNAIGYIGIGHLDKTLKALSVNGIDGSEETAVNGTYPITRPLFMFTSGWPSGSVKKFIDFVLEPSLGQTYVKKAGYLSIYLPTKKGGTPCPKCPPCREHAPCPTCPEITPCPQCPDAVPCPPCETEEKHGESIDTPSEKMTSKTAFDAMILREKVILIQSHLKRLGYSIGRVDGIWGQRSVNAYEAFQKSHGLKPVVEALVHPVLQKMEKTAQ